MSQRATTADQDNRDDGESLVSTDADPIPPRDLPAERETGDMREQEQPEVECVPCDVESLNVPEPDPEWMFNIFLVELADEIVEKELDKLKHLFKNIIKDGLQEKITSVNGLFDHLRRRLLLSSDNLFCLLAMLKTLGRRDLIEKTIKYAKAAGDLIYFYPANHEPLNGFKPVKFHVEGKDFRRFTSDSIDLLRTRIARWVCAQVDDVLIAGVEPSSSMLITILLPELYVDVMEHMLQIQKEDLQPLANLGIDMVQIGDTTYNIYGIEGAEVVETEQQTKLVSVYQQLQDKSRALESMENEVIRLLEEQKSLKQQVEDLELESVALRTLFNKSDSDQQTRPASLASQASLAAFKESIEDVKKLKYETKVIRKLLQASSFVNFNRSREFHIIQLQQLKLIVQSLQSQIAPLQMELLYLRSNQDGNVGNHQRDIEVTLTVTLTDEATEFLKKVSRGLRSKEKEKLERKYTWDPQDDLTKLKNKDQSHFMYVLYSKEINRQGRVVDLVQFVEGCLAEVNRSDLQKKFHDFVLNQDKHHHQQQRTRARSHSGQGPQSGATSMQQPDLQLSNIENEMHALTKKVNWIGSTMSSAMNYGQPFNNPFGPKSFPGAEDFNGPFPYNTTQN